MIISHNNFTINIWHDINTTNCYDLEFHVTFKEKKYFGWAFTPEGILAVMEKDKNTGENSNGSYFWVESLIILKEITIESLVATIEDIINNDPSALDRILFLLEE
ncbi:MAG: hypothetical protein ABWY06_20150 [Pseudomonas sp.]|uniref:hypothetical protein n=1 Tax=Pseudomonas sp. TaxID=306 RepID=UPI003390E637